MHFIPPAVRALLRAIIDTPTPVGIERADRWPPPQELDTGAEIRFFARSRLGRGRCYAGVNIPTYIRPRLTGDRVLRGYVAYLPDNKPAERSLYEVYDDAETAVAETYAALATCIERLGELA